MLAARVADVDVLEDGVPLELEPVKLEALVVALEEACLLTKRVFWASSCAVMP